MEGYTLSKDRKVPKNTTQAVCMACGDSKPTTHKSPKWYSFSLHKAAASMTWQCRLGAQEVRREKLPQFLCSFLQEKEADLNQAAAESADQEATLYIAHPRKLAVGVCSKQWQALTDCKLTRSGSHPRHSAAQHSTYDQQDPKRSKRVADAVENQQTAAAIAALQQQLLEQKQQLQQQLAQLKAEHELKVRQQLAQLKAKQEQQLQQERAAHERKLQQLLEQDVGLQQQIVQLKAEQQQLLQQQLAWLNEQQLQQQKAAHERELQQLRDQMERH